MITLSGRRRRHGPADTAHVDAQRARAVAAWSYGLGADDLTVLVRVVLVVLVLSTDSTGTTLGANGESLMSSLTMGRWTSVVRTWTALHANECLTRAPRPDSPGPEAVGVWAGSGAAMLAHVHAAVQLRAVVLRAAETSETAQTSTELKSASL